MEWLVTEIQITNIQTCVCNFSSYFCQVEMSKERVKMCGELFKQSQKRYITPGKNRNRQKQATTWDTTKRKKDVVRGSAGCQRLMQAEKQCSVMRLELPLSCHHLCEVKVYPANSPSTLTSIPDSWHLISTSEAYFQNHTQAFNIS